LDACAAANAPVDLSHVDVRLASNGRIVGCQDAGQQSGVVAGFPTEVVVRFVDAQGRLAPSGKRATIIGFWLNERIPYVLNPSV